MAAVGAIVFALVVWVTRYQVVSSDGLVYRLDRWTGHVRSEADSSAHDNREQRRREQLTTPLETTVTPAETPR